MLSARVHNASVVHEGVLGRKDVRGEVGVTVKADKRPADRVILVSEGQRAMNLHKER